MVSYFLNVDIFNRAEVVRQSTRNVNGFIDIRMRYKLQFIVTNIFIYVLLLVSGSLYFIETDKKYVMAIVRSISITLVALMSWGMCFLMFYYGFRIRYVLKRQWLVQRYQRAQASTYYSDHQSTDDDAVEEQKILGSTSLKDRNYVLNWMLLLTLFWGLTSSLHFVLSAIFLAFPEVIFAYRLIFWIVCELVPCYIILIFFLREQNHEKIMSGMI